MCLVTIKYKNPSWTNITVPRKYVFPLNILTFHRLEYISEKTSVYLKFGLQYMIPEGISHIHSQLQGLSFLPFTFSGLADLFPQLRSSHGQLCGDIMYLALLVQWQNTCWWCRGPEFKSRVWCLLLFHDDIIGSWVQIWFS